MKPVLIPVLAGFPASVFGFLCLNYTKGFDMDHHVEWAAETGMPGPSHGIYLVGVLFLAAGVGLIGFGLGRRQRGGS
ncbi:MAG: hypothetical protein O7B99_11145 [Planctomycetota bacterium]|nr:hypothetical protein [Planctomycetota bacterium]